MIKLPHWSQYSFDCFTALWANSRSTNEDNLIFMINFSYPLSTAEALLLDEETSVTPSLIAD